MSLGRSLQEAMFADDMHRTLDDLPDVLLNDIGLARSDIPFVAGALASGSGHPIRVALDPPEQSTAEHCAAPRWLSRIALHLALVAAMAVATFVLPWRAVLAQDSQIERGKYLLVLASCNDCHTPGYFFGKPDMSRFLGGSEVGFEIPGLGVFHGPNLTPDKETGLGQWSTEEIAAAITKGVRPDGRMLAPIMPWHAFANLTRQDVLAIAAYLKSLPPISNKVPGPFGPSETPTSFVMKIVPPPSSPAGGAAPK